MGLYWHTPIGFSVYIYQRSESYPHFVSLFNRMNSTYGSFSVIGQNDMVIFFNIDILF